jgi:hypothetical protein
MKLKRSECRRKLHNGELNNLPFIKHYSSDKVKEDEKGETYSIHVSDEKCVQDFGRNTSQEGATWET